MTGRQKNATGKSWLRSSSVELWRAFAYNVARKTISLRSNFATGAIFGPHDCPPPSGIGAFEALVSQGPARLLVALAPARGGRRRFAAFVYVAVHFYRSSTMISA